MNIQYSTVKSGNCKEKAGRNQRKNKKMQLEEPIRSLGYHDVPIRLHTKVTGTLRVKVTEE